MINKDVFRNRFMLVATAFVSVLMLTGCPNRTQNNADDGPHSPYSGVWIQASGMMGYQQQGFCGADRQVRSEMPEAIWVQNNGDVLRYSPYMHDTGPGTRIGHVNDNGYFTPPGQRMYPPFEQYQQSMTAGGVEARFLLDNSPAQDQQKYLFVYPAGNQMSPLYYVRKTDQEALAYFNAISRCSVHHHHRGDDRQVDPRQMPQLPPQGQPQVQGQPQPEIQPQPVPQQPRVRKQRPKQDDSQQPDVPEYPYYR